MAKKQSQIINAIEYYEILRAQHACTRENTAAMWLGIFFLIIIENSTVRDE